MSFARRALEIRMSAPILAEATPAPKTRETATQRRERQAELGVDAVKDRRRFKTTPVPTGDANRVVPADMMGTKFPSRVSDLIHDVPVLKSGVHNSKIGGDVLVGALRGAKIYTLTLEERATCPKDCALWRICYGNSMQYSVRWRHGPELEERLKTEVRLLCTTYERVLIRLHILGDFYSQEYVRLWRELLGQHKGLHVFGFTAWAEDTEIGSEIMRARNWNLTRFAIRHSGRTGPWGSATLDFPTNKKSIGDAIVCPEQVGAMNGDNKGRHCGNCAVCWSCSSPVFFVEH